MNSTDGFIKEAIDVALDDEQYNYTDARPVKRTILQTSSDICSLIGVIFNMLIIYAILKNRRMKSRRNILLLYWAIFDCIAAEFLAIPLRALLRSIVGTDDDRLELCLVVFLTGFFKINCVIIMLLLLSTTVAKMQFIKGAAFQWAMCVFTVVIYIFNVCTCYFISNLLLLFMFVFIFLGLLIILLVKEVNIWCKACRNDGISDETKVRINLVRIYTYNNVLILLGAVFVRNLLDNGLAFLFMLELGMQLTSLYIVIYLCVVDLNFRNAIRYCCRKNEPSDNTVVYNVEENKETVDFTRI